MSMISDIHNIELSFLCQLSKSAPNILWSVRGFLNDNPLQVARSNPAVVVAKVSLQSLLEAHRYFGRSERRERAEAEEAADKKAAQTMEVVREFNSRRQSEAQDRVPSINRAV
jgi:hypothetical protein